jgi:hypothetical protein
LIDLPLPLHCSSRFWLAYWIASHYSSQFRIAGSIRGSTSPCDIGNDCHCLYRLFWCILGPDAATRHHSLNFSMSIQRSIAQKPTK